jgi:hypothetical protein
MRMSWIMFVAAAAVLGSSAPALAQENPYGGGTRLPQRPETIDRGFHEARAVLEQFAHCTVKARPDDVRKYLLEDVPQKEIDKLREKVLGTNCIQGAIGPDDVALSVVGLTLQGALAEEMLARDGLLAQPINVAAVPALHHSDIDPDELKKADPRQQQRMAAEDYLFRFGECVVRADIADSTALLRTPVDSSDEPAAFGRLMPAFAGCVERNRTLTGDKIAIRAAIAYNYYRLASARVPASAVTAANK